MFEPALKSFGFRLEYWQATSAMIGDHLAWGCGPGNFKDTYMLYKLPISSEEISDPHNFLFEIAANAGVPAAIAFGVSIAGFARRLLRAADDRRESNPLERDSLGGDGDLAKLPGSIGWIFAGSAAGFGLAVLLNLIWGFEPRMGESILGVCITGVAVGILLPWIRVGRLPSPLYLIGIGVLLIALSAIGGITFGGVADSLWLLLALGLNASDGPAPSKFFRSLSPG